MDAEAKNKLNQAINDSLDKINSADCSEDEKSIEVQKLDILSRISDETDKKDVEVRKIEAEEKLKKGELNVKRVDVFSKIGMGILSICASLGVMGVIKEIEEQGTVGTKMFPQAMDLLKRGFRL